KAGTVTGEARAGDSIAVNGCCLTVVDIEPGAWFGVDLMAETLARTSLRSLRVGSGVNLERAVRVGDRLDGHIVQGHVDGTGRVLDLTSGNSGTVLRIAPPAELARYLVPKGSITIDGVSLTVVDVVDDVEPWFSVALIPTTLAVTTLGERTAGDRVNLEVDVLGKYVERLLAVGAGR